VENVNTESPKSEIYISGDGVEAKVMTSIVEEPRDSPNVADQTRGEVKLPPETLAAFGGDELRARVFYEKYALRDADGRQTELIPDDLFRRVARELASPEADEEKRKEWTAKFYWLLQDYRFVPGGRILFGAGQMRKSTLLNCFDGDTEVVIRETVESERKVLGFNNSLVSVTTTTSDSVSKAKISGIVGKEVEVLTMEGWKPVVFRSYGRQEVYKVVLRNGDEFIATGNHEWPIFYNSSQRPSKTTTVHLKGKSLFISLPPRPEVNQDFKDGVVHGIIYGDGQKNTAASTYGVYLFGGQRDLVPYLRHHGHVTEYSGQNPAWKGAIYVGGIRSQHDLKAVPPMDVSASYWYGFVLGLVATDGHCTSNGQVGIDQADLGELKVIREQIVRVGMFPNKIFRSREKNPYNGEDAPLYRFNISKFSLREGDLLRADHRMKFSQRRITKKVGNHTAVKDIIPLKESREVYCCTEPVTHTFTIGNGILTGNCYFFKIREDSIEAIFDWCKEAARTYSFGGGVGTDISVLRPRGAPVNNSAIYSSGSVSFMELLSTTTGTIGQAGRRGALMITIRVDHPDVMDFINVKKDLRKVNYANISVKITDDFMRAVESDGDFVLHFKNEMVEMTRTVRAKDVWKSLIRGAWQSAEPGVLFWDTIKRDSTTEYNGMEVQGVNPCSEQTLESYGCCCLGSVNLSSFVKEPFTEKASIDWDSLTRATQYGVRFLDNVLDYNAERHPLKQQKDASLLSRRIGVGITGLGDMLIKLGLKYDDDSTIGFVDHLFERIKNVIYDYSTELAKEKGSFPAFDADKHLAQPFISKLDMKVQEKIRSQGIRNAAITTIPPVGSGSILAGTSSGVEPVFALFYTRRSKSLSEGEFKVFHPLVKEYMATTGAKEDGQLPNYFVTSHQIRPEMRVKMQATIQKHIDTAISSTVNLPEEITPEEVEKIYLLAWRMGCKGITVYREGSREGILETSKVSKKTEQPKAEFERPRMMEGKTLKLKLPQGGLYLTANLVNGELKEVFVTLGKSGGDEKADAEALGRLISLYLQHGGDIKSAISTLKGIKGKYVSWDEGTQLLSIPDAIAKALELLTLNHVVKESGFPAQTGTGTPKQEARGGTCPDCHENTLIFENGCYHCGSCGYSKCE
jgi:ribonucleoside-diphosphate reductase alpha chain